MKPLICPPFAQQLPQRMRSKGTYANGGPRGAVVHFTAGRDGARNTILGGIKDGYTFWCIQKDGLLFCAHDANQRGAHAGKSAWKGLGSPVHNDLIGIEINAAGLLKQVEITGKDGKKRIAYKTWFGTYLEADQVREAKGIQNQMKGWYEKYTPAQERTLVETLMWLKEKYPATFSFDYVLGHDEVAGPAGIGYWRKNDPGAALSMTMPIFRQKLKDEWARRLQEGLVRA